MGRMPEYLSDTIRGHQLITILIIFAFLFSALLLSHVFINNSHNQIRVHGIVRRSMRRLSECGRPYPLEAEFSSDSSQIRHGNVFPWDELWLCDPLRIAYIHIYKSWGTSEGQNLRDNCRRVFGYEAARVFSAWTGDNEVQHYNLKKLCEEYLCISFYRDPIERFLSGYHEVMKRRRASVPEHQSKEHLDHFISRVLQGEEADPHLMPQFNFIKSRISFRNRLDSIFIGPVERSRRMMKRAFCGGLSACHSHTTCDFRWSSEKTRARSDSEYGIHNFTFAAADLSEKQLKDLERHYAVDYCLFGISSHVLKQEDLCSNITVS